MIMIVEDLLMENAVSQVFTSHALEIRNLYAKGERYRTTSLINSSASIAHHHGELNNTRPTIRKSI